MPIDTDETVKYVDSKDKVDKFFDDIKEQNKNIEKCHHCPLMNLTKRQYTNGKHDMVINSFKCHAKDIYFDGNEVFCKNTATMDLIDYEYEEIGVE